MKTKKANYMKVNDILLNTAIDEPILIIRDTKEKTKATITTWLYNNDDLLEIMDDYNEMQVLKCSCNIEASTIYIEV